MDDKIKQQEVNSTAWAACDTFRGVVDPAQYKDYILVMLFLKYISDLWQDHYDAYRKQYGDNDERIRRKLDRERFTLPMVEFKDEKTGKVVERFAGDFNSLYERRNAANIGELINIVLDGIEDANKAKLAGVETPIDYAIFQDHGYKGLYGGRGAKDIHAIKGLKKSQKILDHMGSTEMAANLFRATQTEEKLRRDQVRGKQKANQTHFEVGKKVRQTIDELGGTMPEALPTPEKSIQQIESAKKKLASRAQGKKE